MSARTSRLFLQIAIAIGGLVPVGSGLSGALWGTNFLGLSGDITSDSHARYLSGLLLGIGLLFWATIPRVEIHSQRFRILTTIVFIGGLARATALFANGQPEGVMYFALAMELIVTPLLCLWQHRVALRF